jgi:hypothetical protein
VADFDFSIVESSGGKRELVTGYADNGEWGDKLECI